MNKLEWHKTKEYHNSKLKEYKTKHLYFDRNSCGLAYLDDVEKDDLTQELNLKCIRMMKSGKHYEAANIKSYCRKAYKNVVMDFARKYIKVTKKEDRTLEFMTKEKLLDLKRRWDNDDPPCNYYWEYDCLEGLTPFEKKVIFLKYTKQCSNAEIIWVTKYQGTESGLRNVYFRAVKKIEENSNL